jgi:hypothetical protein
MVGGPHETTEEPAGPARRVVVLGASNVSLGLSSLIACARAAWGEPLDILAAAGHGRSYGTTSTVLGRSLPAILQCGLWEELRNRPPLPTAALLTDIGNDLLYGRNVPTILRWVEACLEQLQPVADRLVVTRLPLASLERTSSWKLRLLVSLIFPSSRLELAPTLDKARQLDAQLVSFAGRFRAYIVQPDDDWYRWDPIHVTRARRIEAWQKYLSCWCDGEKTLPPRDSLHQWLTAARARPQQWRYWGRQRQRQQPCATFADGTRLSLF